MILFTKMLLNINRKFTVSYHNIKAVSTQVCPIINSISRFHVKIYILLNKLIFKFPSQNFVLFENNIFLKIFTFLQMI